MRPGGTSWSSRGTCGAAGRGCQERHSSRGNSLTIPAKRCGMWSWPNHAHDVGVLASAAPATWVQLVQQRRYAVVDVLGPVVRVECGHRRLQAAVPGTSPNHVFVLRSSTRLTRQRRSGRPGRVHAHAPASPAGAPGAARCPPWTSTPCVIRLRPEVSPRWPAARNARPRTSNSQVASPDICPASTSAKSRMSTVWTADRGCPRADPRSCRYCRIRRSIGHPGRLGQKAAHDALSRPNVL